ncbi:myosin heavy chain, clone 203-like [Toxorhynchites rutilus septentrionalis]|uniref:myosin heavy chain, clone 203-like n=1 Tax=Toxorhynchites rutilus septentrionalis TaxID=329112 RepID=UPI002478C971|nr:myosin heavy chain, clone 203-like [Toxorhynchites rutilus septentrionalis]
MSALVPILLGAIILASSNNAKEFSCDADRKACVLHNVVLDSPRDLDNLSLLDTTESIIIASGRIPFFTRQLAEKFSNTVDMTISGIEIEEVYVKPQMTHLEAANNHITRLQLDDTKSYELITLNLTNNKLREVHILSKFYNLRILTLDENELQSLSMDTFAGMSELRLLSVARNKITTVDTSTNFHLVKLHTLSLAGNQLYELDINNWELDSLSKFDLSNNDLYLLNGDLMKFIKLKQGNIAGNHWKCDYLLEMLRLSQVTFDADVDNRCSNKRMKTVRQICCNPDATSFLGETSDGEFDLVFKEKWDELRALGETVQTLNRSLLATDEQIREAVTESEISLREKIDQLEEKCEEKWQRFEERESSVAIDETNELKQIVSDHKDSIQDLTEKQSELNEKIAEIESRVQTLEDQFFGVDKLNQKLESFDSAVERCKVTEKSVRQLEENQLRYNILGVELKDKFLKERARTNELNSKFDKTSESSETLKNRVNDLEKDMATMRKIIRELASLEY